MIIDNDNLVIFFHIPKNSGTVVHRIFSPNKYQNIVKLWKEPVYNKEPDMSHLNMKNYLKYIKPHLKHPVGKYFKWCCIRNPYDRFISGFNECVRHVQFRKWATSVGIKEYRNINVIMSYILKHPHCILNDNVVWISPQYIYIYNAKGENQMDLIIPVEKMNGEYCKLANKYKYPLKNIKNVSGFKYEKQYTPKLLAFVEKIYSKDFKLLKFSKYIRK